MEFFTEAIFREFSDIPDIPDTPIDAPKAAMFGQEMYPSLHQKAAAYLYHIVRNHPFNDANKRTGYAVALVFLDVNGIKPACSKEALESLVIEVAKGRISKEMLAQFLEYGYID